MVAGNSNLIEGKASFAVTAILDVTPVSSLNITLIKAALLLGITDTAFN